MKSTFVVSLSFLVLIASDQGLVAQTTLEWPEIECPIGPFDCVPPDGPPVGPKGPFKPAPQIKHLKTLGKVVITHSSKDSVTLSTDEELSGYLLKQAKEHGIKAGEFYQLSPSALPDQYTTPGNQQHIIFYLPETTQ